MKKWFKLLPGLLPLCMSAATPALYIPLDGTPDVIGPDGKKIVSGIGYGRVNYQEGIVGKGADVRRHAYDQVGAIHFNKLPDFNYNTGTVSFWFKPHWKETDPVHHVILSSGNWKGFRFYFIKGKNGTIELSVCAPGQIQFLSKNLFKPETWAHVAFSWDTAKGEARLYIDGRLKAHKVNKKRFNVFPSKQSMKLWLGENSHDRFKAVVGNGVYDEIKIFPDVLSPDEIFSLASGGAKDKLLPVSLANIFRNSAKTEFVFRCKEASFGGPKKLAEFKYGAKNVIFITAMGSSGRLSMFLDDGKKIRSVESACVLNLDEAHKLAFAFEKGNVVFLIDGIRQGALPFEQKVTLQSVSVAEGVTFPALNSFPTVMEREKLSSAKTSKLEDSIWTLSDAEKRTAGVRKGVTLNGYWRVNPVLAYSFAPDGKWGYMRVPGSFRSPLWNIYRDNGGKLEPIYWKWNKKPLISHRAGWYQRVFTVPADLMKKGERIYLNFENLNGDFGKVVFNGKMIDSFRQDFKSFTMIPNKRRLDVTDLLSKDGKNVVTVFIDRAYVGLWHGVPSIGDHGELAIGDVWLESSPSKFSLVRGIAMPSFRNREVSFRTRIANPAGVKGEFLLKYDFLRGSKIEKSFEKSFVLTGAPEQVVLFKQSWSNPVLWSADDPQTYRMAVSISADGKMLDSLPSSTFGFREAWVENGEFRMNGKKLRMRMWTSPGLGRLRFFYGNKKAIASHVEHIKSMNYNGVRFDPIRKTSQVAFPEYLEECNLQGLYNLFPMPPYEDEEINGYSDGIERFLETYGNHPAILMWYTDFNTCGYSWDQDPAKLNDTQYDPVEVRHARQRAYTAEKLMRSFDPTREIFQHAGGNSGKIFTSMNYQSFGTPLQEQEDWPAQWSKKHTQPLMVVESAFPFPLQFWHFDNAQKYGAMTAEHAARYFGDASFGEEVRPVPNANHWFNNPYSKWNANYLRLSDMLYSNVVKAWRAYDMSALGDFPGGRDMHTAARTYNNHNVVYGIDNNVKTAGLKPDVLTGWSETQTHLLTDYTIPEALDSSIRASFNPLLVYLGGDPADFTNKDHAFFAGENFRKSFVIVNDYLSPRTLDLGWELVADGKTLAKGSSRETVDAGGIVKAPIEIAVPDVLKRMDAELRISVLKDGVLYKEDSMKLQFFPKRVRPAFHNLAAGLYDPEGKTEALLKKAGYPYFKVNSIDDVRKTSLLVIGQNALEKSLPDFLKQLEEEKLIEDGLKILIFEQKQCNLGNLVFESPSHRNAFIRRPDSRYLAGLGLSDADFANWRGSSDTVPAFVTSSEKTPHYPRSKWKCGNGGIVSGHVIRKPSYGNFTSIVDSGFNLMFSSLLELRKNHGIVLFCQLDVTSRYMKDPVATKLVDNILFELNKRFVPVGPVRVKYLGDPEGKKILDRMGVVYTVADLKNLWGLNSAQVVILGPFAKKPEEKTLASLVKLLAGRSVVALPGAPLELLQGNMSFGKKNIFRATVPENDPVFAGIPNADLYFREVRELPVVNGPDWMIATKPALFAKLDRETTSNVILALSPEAIDGLWNAEKVSRVWNTILDNMNIGLGRDLQLFTGVKSRHNTKLFRFGEITPENGLLKFDLKNDGKLSDTEGFIPVKIGKSFEAQGFQKANPFYQYPPKTPKNLMRPYDGYAWYRITFRIPAAWKEHIIKLIGGPIDDCDWTYLNGVKIGETTLDNHPAPYKARRDYPIPEKIVKFGAENTLVVRVFDRWGHGGIVGPISIVAEDAKAMDSWSPYIDKLNFYDVDAFHNW